MSRWVLVSEGGSGESRGALATVRVLAAAGYQCAVTVSGPLSLAAASRHCRAAIEVPSVFDDPHGFAAAVRAELARRHYLDLLCASDAALTVLDRPGRALLDKEQTALVAQAAGFAVPQTRVFATRAELLDHAGELEYPVVVKPVTKEFLAVRVDRASQLPDLVIRDARLLVQPFLNDGLRGVLGVMWDGTLVQAVHLRYLRVWPQPCGTVSAAETTAPDLQIEAALQRLLAGYNGLFHVDLAGDHLLDVNPRIHAATALAYAAGVNLPAAYCDLVSGEQVPHARGRAGVHFRWEEGDARNVVRQRRQNTLSAGEAWRALRPRRGTVHSVISLRDPGPAVARGRYLVRRLRRGEPIAW